MSLPWTVTQEGYDLISKTLRLTFTTGAIYEFEGVPPEKYEALMAVPLDARGDYFEEHILNLFPMKRIV